MYPPVTEKKEQSNAILNYGYERIHVALESYIMYNSILSEIFDLFCKSTKHSLQWKKNTKNSRGTRIMHSTYTGNINK